MLDKIKLKCGELETDNVEQVLAKITVFMNE